MNSKIKKIISVDKYRSELVDKQHYSDLIKSYFLTQPSFIDENNEKFWNSKICLENGEDYITQRRIRIIYKEIITRRVKHVLDIGVGQAYLEKLFFIKGVKVFFAGVDIVDIKPKYLFKLGCFKIKKITKLPFKNSSFKLITLLEVLEHIKAKYTFSVLHEISRVLDKGGILIVSVPVNENIGKISHYNKSKKGYVNPNSHMRMYHKNLLIWELQKSGFEIENYYEIIAFNKFGNFLNFANKFLNRWESNNLIIIARKI